MKDNKIKNNISIKLITLITASIAPFTVNAEDKSEVKKDIMVVTATRTEKKLQEVSSSIAVVTSEEIAEKSSLSFNEVLLNIPNVDISDVSSPMFSKMSIRGSNPAQITYLIDGMRQDNFTLGGNRFTGIFIEPEMIKQVEVRRGGGSAMYGNGGIGGTVAVTSKMAGDFLRSGEDFGSKIKTGYASVNHDWQKSVFAYGRHDIWDVIIGVSRRDSDDLRTSLGYRPNNNTDTSFTSVMAKISAFPNEDSLFSFSYNYDLGKDYWGKHGNIDDYQNKQHRITGLWEYTHGDLIDLRTTLQYVKSEFTYNNQRMTSKDHFDSWSGNIQNTSQLSLVGEHWLTYGGDFSQTNQRGVSTNPFNTSTHNNPSRPDSKGIDMGIFIQDDYQINQYVAITPVVRWNYYKRESNKGLGDQSDNAFTPGITATFTPTYNLSFWASANMGYRPPILDELFYTLDFPGQHHVHPNPDLKPEKSKNYEIGVNTSFTSLLSNSDTLDIKGSLFWDDVKNFINIESDYTEPYPNSPPPTWTWDYRSENIGHVVRKGIEISGAYNIGNLSVKPSYGLVHAIDRKNDKRVRGITPQSLSIYSSYDFPSLKLKPWYQAIWHDGGFTRSKLEYGSFTTHSIGVSWKPNIIGNTDINANISIQNLTDKKYRYLNNSTGYGRGIRASLAIYF